MNDAIYNYVAGGTFEVERRSGSDKLDITLRRGTHSQKVSKLNPVEARRLGIALIQLANQIERTN